MSIEIRSDGHIVIDGVHAGAYADVAANYPAFADTVLALGAAWESDRQAREAEDLARRTRHVELSMDPDFQIEFGEAMMFPMPLEA